MMAELLAQRLFKATMEPKGMQEDQEEAEVLPLLQLNHLETPVVQEELVERIR
jgi:hypothetical protein